MIQYYNDVAETYDEIYKYLDPVRIMGINHISEKLSELFIKKNVLEIACGTGYWTEALSKVALSITAVDKSIAMLKIAKNKNINNATLVLADAYNLDCIDMKFNAGVSIAWFSHIPKKWIPSFFQSFHNKLLSGSVVFMADSIRKSSKSPSHGQDEYVTRVLKNKNHYQVLKNYYTEVDLKRIFMQHVHDVEIETDSNFWYVKYKIP